MRGLLHSRVGLFRRGTLLSLCGVALCTLVVAQNVNLKGKVQLTRNGRRIGDATKVVVWLTSLGSTPDPDMPKQQPSDIPLIVQKDKAFHPSLVVIPAGGVPLLHLD